MRLYLIIALALLVAAVSASAQTVMVQSGRYADFRQLLSREAPADSATLAMTLRLPDEAHDRYPAVVIVHTIAGYQEANEGWHADAFRKAGFATLTYSSVAARALREAGTVGGWPSAVAEAYAAFFGCWPIIPESTASASPSSGFRTAARSRCCRRWNGCVLRWYRARRDLPRMSPTIRRASTPPLASPAPTRARRS
jgi:hypothetical protein